MNITQIMKRGIAVLLTAALILSVLPGSSIRQTAKTAQAAGYGISNPTTDESGVTTWDCIYFGNYYQSSETAKEPIKWRVLSVNGDDAFLLADQNLDCKQYNETYTSVTWETSTLRSWLNGYGAGSNINGKDYSTDNFLDAAFSPSEQAAIRTTSVINEDNPNYGTEGGNNTQDKIYLLSIAEASNAAYGFHATFGTESETRYSKNTEYAKTQGASTTSSASYAGNGVWWLRSPGNIASNASNVFYYGDGFYGGSSVNYYYLAVRPALHLNLSSDRWRGAGQVTSAGGSNGGEVSPSKVMGSLNNVSSDAGIKIDSTTYEVTDSDVLADAANILNDYGNTVVIGTIQNGTVTKISAVINMIEPKVEIKPDINGLLYSDGKYDKTKFKVNVRLYWDVKKGYAGLGGYKMSDFEGYLDQLSDQAVTIENLTIAQVYEQDDKEQENAFVEFSDGWFSSNIRYSKDINLTLKPGEEKTYEINAKVNEDVKLKKAANLFDFEADAKKSTGSTVKDHLRDTYTLHVTKPVSSVRISRDTDVNACKNLLNSTTWVCDETPLYEIFGTNSKEIDAIKYEVSNYILSMHAMVDMSTESDNAIAKKD